MANLGLGILAPPIWLCEHPEIQRKGIKLEIPLKPVREYSFAGLTL